jgi:hypothetical protein
VSNGDGRVRGPPAVRPSQGRERKHASATRRGSVGRGCDLTAEARVWRRDACGDAWLPWTNVTGGPRALNPYPFPPPFSIYSLLSGFILSYPHKSERNAVNADEKNEKRASSNADSEVLHRIQGLFYEEK